nr:uncharacterized protein LOC127346911 [Lolium perenne]
MAKPSQLVARRMVPSIITAWHTATPRHQNNGGDEVAVDHPTSRHCGTDELSRFPPIKPTSALPCNPSVPPSFSPSAATPLFLLSPHPLVPPQAGSLLLPRASALVAPHTRSSSAAPSSSRPPLSRRSTTPQARSVTISFVRAIKNTSRVSSPISGYFGAQLHVPVAAGVHLQRVLRAGLQPGQTVLSPMSISASKRCPDVSLRTPSSFAHTRPAPRVRDASMSAGGRRHLLYTSAAPHVFSVRLRWQHLFSSTSIRSRRDLLLLQVAARPFPVKIL